MKIEEVIVFEEKDFKKRKLFIGSKYKTIKTIPKEINKFKNLQDLSLFNLGIEFLPIEIFDLKKITNLELNDLNIVTIPKEIENLKKLHTIRLKLNKIKKLPDEFNNLENLLCIDLYFCNNLKDFSNIDFSNFKNLKYLTIKWQNLTKKSCNVIKSQISKDCKTND